MRSFVWFSVLLLVTASATTAQTASKARVRAAKPNSAVSAREILDDLREEINRSLEAEYGFEVRQ